MDKRWSSPQFLNEIIPFASHRGPGIIVSTITQRGKGNELNLPSFTVREGSSYRSRVRDRFPEPRVSSARKYRVRIPAYNVAVNFQEGAWNEDGCVAR